MVYCGNQEYLIVKNVENNRIIYAEHYTNGYTFWPYGDIRWEIDEDGEDVLVDDRIYIFHDHDGLLTLMDGCEEDVKQDGEEDSIIIKGFVRKAGFFRGDVHIEHRTVKYKRDKTQQKQRSYDPFGAIHEFNCEMVVVEDTKNELFERWKSQDKCRIFMEDGSDNPQHPKHNEWLESKKLSFDFFIEEKSWDTYNYENVYF